MLCSASVDGIFIGLVVAINTQFFFLNSLAFPGCQQTQLAFFFFSLFLELPSDKLLICITQAVNVLQSDLPACHVPWLSGSGVEEEVIDDGGISEVADQVNFSHDCMFDLGFTNSDSHHPCQDTSCKLKLDNSSLMSFM